MSLRDGVATYQKKRCKIDEPAILIRINKLYRYGMTGAELYDITRGVWKVNTDRAARARYAFAVYQGIVREVYAINRWLDAGSTYSAQNPHGARIKGRSEFAGTLAEDRVRRK